MNSRGRSGFTLVEMCIVIGLLGIIFYKLSLVMTQAQEVGQRETASIALEDRAAVVLNRIAYAVIGCDADTLTPDNPVPFGPNRLEFKLSLGVEDNQIIWGDPEMIGLADDASQLFWGRNVESAEEQIVVWCRTVAEFYSSEQENGLDDNANGITDESGLCFAIEGDSVTIYLTLEQIIDDRPVRFTKSTVVTCRN